MAECSNEFGRWLSTPPPGEEVVITGLSGRFPESYNVHEFRDNLFNKKNMMSDAKRRWNIDHPEVPKKLATVYDIDKIDAGYFGLHYRQAQYFDPETRKFLETAIEAIIDAGLNPSELEGTNTGVFVGASFSEAQADFLGSVTESHTFSMTGYLRNFTTDRLSYYLKLKGPSLIVDTACSSSANALDVAFRAIRQGLCENAIVGGVNLLMHPAVTRQFYRLGVLSPDGICKPFEDKADGYVRGEAAVCIFLQKAANARRIYGTILQGKANDDGFKPLGITFPSTEMQETLMREVLLDTEIEPSQIEFMEAHATGTQVGDPQEMKAIDNAIAKDRNTPLLIGSVKGNIGHSEPASALCSLAKVLIAFETGLIPPNINVTNIKKDIEGFHEGRMTLVRETTKLNNENAIVAINNFGFGGSNVHILLKRHSKTKTSNNIFDDSLPRLVCVSGRTEEAVSVLLKDLKNRPFDDEYIGLLHQIFKTDVKNHNYRGYVILTKKNWGQICAKPFSQNRKTVFMYLGPFEKGYKALKEIFVNIPVFREIIDKVTKSISECQGEENNNEPPKDFSQSFTTQIAFVKLLKFLDIDVSVIYSKILTKQISENYPDFAPDNNKYLPNYEELLENQDNFVVTLSDEVKYVQNEFALAGNSYINFLNILGRLYTEGYNPQIHLLYPEIKFPVSRSTPMISPLIKWSYDRSWYTYKFGDKRNDEIFIQDFNLSGYLMDDQKYLLGHVIDGRNLVPATKYLHMVWDTFRRAKNMLDDNVPIIFENCRFKRAATLSKTSALKLLVSIQKCSGFFEILEKNVVLVSGRIFSPENIKEHETYLEPIEFNDSDRAGTLEKDEIYRELYLRGYNYEGLFKGLVKCNVEASAGLVCWENNWITFIDKMLQLKILQIDTRLLYVPVTIQKLVIDPIKHVVFAAECNDSLCPVYSYADSNIVKSGGIEICGLKATSITRKKIISEPVLEKMVFVPNNTKTSLKDSTRIISQIILENSLENTFKAVEILDNFSKEENGLVLPLVCDALDDIPLVIIDATVSTKNNLEEEIPGIKIENNLSLTPNSNLSLIIASNILERQNVLSQIVPSLGKNGYILARENIDFSSDIPDFEILIEHVVNNEKLILFRKLQTKNQTKYIEINSKKFDWITKLQQTLKCDNDVTIYAHNQDPEGIIGLINCLRREPGRRRLSCFFMIDNNVPEFDPKNNFYVTQIKKNAAVNIYYNGKWGTYRHLKLDETKETTSEHVYINTTTKNDISSLKWIQGPLHFNTEVAKNQILIFPYYTAINFKDIMVASGRVNIDAIFSDRLAQESMIGFEFSGKDITGRRYSGMIDRAGMSTIVVANRMSLWEVPDEWSLEDAGTVTVVYVTVIYALLCVIKIKPGTSILIHSATGGVGLAALNVCLHHGCNIYVTVGTKEKKDYLRKHYPQICESHIGNSRDTTFEEMIKKETGGCGVDVVLNSLSDEKLWASVRCLASGGDFLEIGKYDIGNDTTFNLLLLEKNINYHGVMLDRIFVQSPEIKVWLTNTLLDGIKLGYVKPLPKTIFEKNEVEKAFRYMMTGKHVGKVLLKIRNENDALVPNEVFKGFPKFWCDSQKTYIIVGGLGGFGLELADWLFLRDAKNLILVSRSGIQTGYQKQRIRIWKSKGVNVQISTEDVTTKEGCINLIRESSKFGEIDAIFNLAAILKDSLFEDQTEESFTTAFAPKAHATIFLDQVTREHCPNLKYFVVFSSVTCGRGNPGQTNYGMANSVMERICENRRRDGLPGLAIQWGAIGDVGLVAKMQKENKELVIGGTLQQKICSCLDVFDKFLHQDHPVVASMVVAEKRTNKYGSESAVERVAYILGIKDIKSVGYHTPFVDMGMDSMMGTEMIQILEQDYEIYLTAKDIRSLTFAKLMDLESEHSEKTNSDNKQLEVSVSLLFQAFTPLDGDYTSVINIPSRISDHEKAPTVFVLPGIGGTFDILEPLTKNLRAHVFGIQYKFENPEQSLQECCENILLNIEEKLSKQDPFYIIAYSFGTLIAGEIILALEKKGYFGKFISVEGSPQLLKKTTIENFPSSTESEFETFILFHFMKMILPIDLLNTKKEEFIKCPTFEDRLDLASTLVPRKSAENEKSRQVMIVFHRRLKYVIDYKIPNQKIKSKTHLFKATIPMVQETENDYGLSELCEDTDVITLDGDHSTILNQELLAKNINDLLVNVN